MTQSKRRRVLNEQLFKAENEQIDKLIRPILNETGNQLMPLSFVCECSNPFCHESIRMNILEYQKVRRIKNRFMVKPGHEQPDIEVVTQENRNFFVVQKPSMSRA